MSTCPDVVKRLVERFDQQSDQIRSPEYNETLVRIDFINPLMRELGWDIDNSAGHAEQYREVVHEDHVKVAGQTKAPDYSFRVGGQRKFFLEAKKPAVNIKENWEPAYQLRRYGWSAKLACSLLTDFEEFAIYDCRKKPKQFDKPSVARRDYFRYTEYEERWGFLYGTFSKEAVLKGEFDRYIESKKGRGGEEFDDEFLAEIEEWRKSIASNLALRNDSLDEASLNFAVQRIIDRIIFLRIAEDRGTEPIGQLQSLLNGDKTYDRLKVFFRAADARYNSGLFHFDKEKGRDEAPDTLTPSLAVADKTIKGIVKALYYPESPYEFTMVSADILGSVYERFLGKVITLTPGHRAKIEEKPEVRKAGGVYYTPTYIVDYIVKNTVGKLLEDKTPKQAAKIKVLDPACGSGSFLIGAYQFLLDWYFDQYFADDPQAHCKGKKPTLRPTPTGGWALTIAERKRILLAHIHGVDLDGQAVEVTKLNLLLKCLEGETAHTLGFEQKLFRDRALPDLGANIKCGNSLIATDIIGTDAWNEMSEEEQRRINPFDYERAFEKVFKGKNPGFDAVIGNPPYLNIRGLSQVQSAEVKKIFKASFRCAYKGYDLYVLFIEQAHRLLVRNGLFGMIIPNKIGSLDYSRNCRELIVKETAVLSIADVSGLNVFKDASVYPYIIVFRKSVPHANNEIIFIHPNVQGDLASNSCMSIICQSDLDIESGFSLHGTLDVEKRVLTDKLSEVAKISSGTTGFMAEQTAQVIEEIEIGDYSYFPFVVTGNIDRYYYGLGNVRFIKRKFQYPGIAKDCNLLSDGKKTLFSDHKIIVGGMTRRIEAALDLEGLSLGVNVFAINSASIDDRYILSILNSNLMSYLFRLRFQAKHLAGGYLAINKGQLAQLPIARVVHESEKDNDSYHNLIQLADSMLSLHKRLADEQLPQHREQIQREIDATDRQIDQLVYELYGLTEEEIAIVEEATA